MTSAAETMRRRPEPSARTRLVLGVLLSLVTLVGLWRSQHYAMDAIGPRPGVWPPWAWWPGLVLTVAVLLLVPTRWPRVLRWVGSLLALVAFCSTALVADAVIGRVLLEGRPGVVNADSTLSRSVHRVTVAVGGVAVPAYSPAASFAGGQQRDGATGTRHFTPGLTYGRTGTYAVGTPVTIQQDRGGRLYTRILPAAGQPGYVPWFPRGSASLVAWSLIDLLGWSFLAAALLAPRGDDEVPPVRPRGPRRGSRGSSG